MNTQARTHTPRRTPPRAAHGPPCHRRIMLVTTRCSTLIALQRACRADQAVQFRFYANPAAAIGALDWFRPDALLLDAACIGRTGPDLVERVRGMVPSPTVAVLADSVGPCMDGAVERVGADGGLAVTAPDLLERLGALAPRHPEVRADVT